MIPDRIIEQGTLNVRDGRVAVEVRLPWYRALPASCISAAKLTIDGVEAPAETLRWEMNGAEFTFAEMKTNTEQWWFPTDSAVLSGDLAVDAGEHEVRVDLELYIPYIIIADDQVLHIEEHDTKTMTARQAEEALA
ncbi:C-glycoside deglycosidase beta subunit domain-containing protein [Microbacterium sp. SLBN-111]|uniref:C-glycoside deglycosidase beta subunit domain-containing protein n=1 Tax=Microbacterium sp. SLBN-111 TaxID=3377733 RepID=UPI003C7845C3